MANGQKTISVQNKYYRCAISFQIKEEIPPEPPSSNEVVKHIITFCYIHAFVVVASSLLCPFI